MLFFCLFFLALCVYMFFSYVLTDPNLVISSHPLYWNFQTYMWENFYANSEFLTATYIFIILTLFFSYLLIVRELSKNNIEFNLNFKSKYLWLFILVLVPVLISYNALSHDLFNYMFYAKMILVYKVNPYLMTPFDFVGTDEWVRFMHNIEVINVYGYSWTALSLIPSILGFNKFLLTLVSFKLFTVFGVFLLYHSVQHLSFSLQKRSLYLHELALLFLNPLFLLEAISNHHNDLWMMIPAIFSVSILIRVLKNSASQKSDFNIKIYFILSLLLLILSISIKLVTIVLIPIYLFIAVVVFFLPQYSVLIQKRFHIPIPSSIISRGIQFVMQFIEKYIPTFVAVLLFATLFSERSRYFYPWYFIWIIVWIPFIKFKLFRHIIIVFSLSSLLRYVPWLANGFEYSAEIISQQKMITWGIPALYLLTRLKDTVSSTKMFGKK